LIKRYADPRSTFDIAEDNSRLLFQKLFDDIKEVCRNLFRTMMNKANRKVYEAGKISFLNNLEQVFTKLSEIDPTLKAIIDAAFDEASKMTTIK